MAIESRVLLAGYAGVREQTLSILRGMGVSIVEVGGPLRGQLLLAKAPSVVVFGVDPEPPRKQVSMLLKMARSALGFRLVLLGPEPHVAQLAQASEADSFLVVPTESDWKESFRRLVAEQLTRHIPRESPRAQCLLQVAAGTKHGIMQGTIVNISSDGARMRVGKSFDLDDELDLGLPLDGEEIKVKARVAWTGPDSAQGVSLVGLSFLGVTTQQGKALGRFIRRNLPLLYPAGSHRTNSSSSTA